MPKKTYPDTFKEIISGSLPGKLAQRLPPPELGLLWPELVGEAIARRSRPVALEQGGVLVVAVKGAVWRQELSFQALELTRRLREHGYNLASIKFVMDRSKAKAPPPPPPLPELNDEEEAQVWASVASVRDPKLKQALAGVRRAQMRARKGGYM